MVWILKIHDFYFNGENYKKGNCFKEKELFFFSKKTIIPKKCWEKAKTFHGYFLFRKGLDIKIP